MNDGCQWPGGAAQDAEAPLAADVRVAEELAIRYADARFDSKASHGRLRSECEARLFALLATTHGVPLAAVEAARRELAAQVWDPLVHLPLAAFYIAASLLLARRLSRRFARDEALPAVIATLFVSLVMALVLQVLGHLWDGAVEMIRIGNTHMSYRVERLGWRGYGEEVFAASVLLFWCAVLFSRTAQPD